MKKIKELIIKYGSTLTAFAFMVSAMMINGTCRYFFHDPEVPKELVIHRNEK